MGVIGFGGPSAHLALFRQRFVRDLGWISEQTFLDLLGVASLLPGPTSTEVALAIGQARAGFRGLLAAGLGFVGPAAIAVLLLAIGYERFGAVPGVAWLLYGIQPVVVAIVALAIVGLAPVALRGPVTWLIGGAAVAALLLGVDPLAVIIGCGIAAVLWQAARRIGRGGIAGVAGLMGVGLGALHLGTRHSLAALPSLGARPGLGSVAPAVGSVAPGFGGRPGLGSVVPAVASVAVAGISLPSLFLIFLKIGLLSFGSGYVLVAFLHADLVQGLGLLTDHQLLDAVAVGQVTPGPVYTAATFIGYLAAGIPGAVVATIAIFLPGFVGVALVHPFVPRLRASATTAALLDGVNAASLGLMAAVTLQLARSTIVDPVTLGLAAVSFLVLLRRPRTAVLLMIGGGLVGLAVHAANLV